MIIILFHKRKAIVKDHFPFFPDDVVFFFCFIFHVSGGIRPDQVQVGFQVFLYIFHGSHTAEIIILHLLLLLILRQILFQDETNSMAAESLALSSEAVKYATIVVATVPILAAYPFLQRYFVKGVMVGAVKG